MQVIKTKVIIADHHCLFSDGLEHILNVMPGFEVQTKVTKRKTIVTGIKCIGTKPYINGHQHAFFKWHRCSF